MAIQSEDYLKQLMIFDYNRQLKCRCGWIGMVNESNKRPYRSSLESWSSLSGRQGWQYFCPTCGVLLTANYTVMS